MFTFLQMRRATFLRSLHTFIGIHGIYRSACDEEAVS